MIRTDGLAAPSSTRRSPSNAYSIALDAVITARPRPPPDRPTGKLHLGHYVGSLANRVRLQDVYDCYFIVGVDDDGHEVTVEVPADTVIQARVPDEDDT